MRLTLRQQFPVEDHSMKCLSFDAAITLDGQELVTGRSSGGEAEATGLVPMSMQAIAGTRRTCHQNNRPQSDKRER
jgi:hypothetical protein